MQNTVTKAEDLLLLLHNFQALTIYQVVRLLGKENTINNIRNKLKQLVDGGLVETRFLPRTSPSGRTPIVYSLSQKGSRALEEAGLASSVSRSHKGVLYVQHLLEVNDVVIAARLFPRYERRVAISEVRYENHFKQHPIYVDKNMFLCPDGYVHFILSPPYDEPGTSLGVILEIDRGSEDVNTIIRNKIKNYRRFFSSGFDQVFDIESFVVAFVVTSGGSARVKQLVSCTEKELVGTPGVGDFFIFTSVDSSRIDPLPFFTSPVWLQPFRASPVPLI